MASCNSCGVSIPEGQGTCSMCYGDVDHGTDGHYQQDTDQQEQKE